MSKIVLKNECYKEKTILETVDLNDVEFSGNNMNNAFKNCTNLKKVININADVTTLDNAFTNCSSLVDDIYIESENITSCEGIFDGNTYIKKVYIPYYNSNHQHTITYNTFIAAGYTETGTKNCIYLDDINNPNDLKIYRFKAVENYRSRYGFTTDDGTAVFSLSTNWDDPEQKPSRINFYNRDGELIDYFYMPNRGSIDGLNATSWQPFLGCVGLDMPTTNQYSTFQKCRFFKCDNKYWAYYLDLPFYIWYSFIEGGNLHCFPNSPWQANRTTLYHYVQTGLNTFTHGTNTATTTYCYPVYYSHANNIIYSLYMTQSGGANSKYILNMDVNYNIVSKTEGFTVIGDEFKVYWYSNVATAARELNADFTPGNLQITCLADSNNKTRWFVISETSRGILDCNSTRNTNLNSYFDSIFGTSSNVPDIYPLPNKKFIAFRYTSTGYKVYQFHFNGNEVVDDGLYLSIPAGYAAPSNGAEIFVNYFTKEVGWCFTKSDTAEYVMVTRQFSATTNLPSFPANNVSITINDSLYDSTQDSNGVVKIIYKGNQQNVVLPGADIPLAVQLQFKDAYTGQIIENIYDDLVIPYVNFYDAIATRNMFEFLVPRAGTYYIGFTEDQSHNNKYLPVDYYNEFEIFENNQIITINLIPNPDMPDTKFEGTIKSWYGNNDPYYNYMLLNNNTWLLANFYDYTDNKSYALPLTTDFTINEWDILNTEWDTDLYPEGGSWLEDYSYVLPCFGNDYYTTSPNPKRGDHVFTFTTNGTSCEKNIIAEFTGEETTASGKAYIDSNNQLHINGIGIFDYNPNKSGLIIQY